MRLVVFDSQLARRTPGFFLKIEDFKLRKVQPLVCNFLKRFHRPLVRHAPGLFALVHLAVRNQQFQDVQNLGFRVTRLPGRRNLALLVALLLLVKHVPGADLAANFLE